MVTVTELENLVSGDMLSYSENGGMVFVIGEPDGTFSKGEVLWSGAGMVNGLRTRIHIRKTIKNIYLDYKNGYGCWVHIKAKPDAFDFFKHSLISMHG